MPQPLTPLPTVQVRCEVTSPCYHLITDAVPSHVRHLYPCRTSAEFERELDWLLARFQPVSLEQIAAWKIEGGAIPQKALFLSFDDGFREMAEIVAPLCKRKGVPLTFFLTTDFLDNNKLGYRHKASLLVEELSKLDEAKRQNLLATAARQHELDVPDDHKKFLLSLRYNQTFVLDELAAAIGLDFGEYLKTERPYLNSDQVKGLLRDGFSIAAHSLDHPRYSEITLEQQIEQTRGSIRFLETSFGIRRRAFAFPFVSDGVSDEFYRRVFSDRICDIAFCIGEMPRKANWPVVERFGVERENEQPIWTILRDMRRGRLRSRIRRTLAPLRKFVS